MSAKKQFVSEDFEKLKARIAARFYIKFHDKIGNVDDCIGYSLESMLKNPGQTVDQAIIDYIRKETGARKYNSMPHRDQYANSKIDFYFKQSLDVDGKHQTLSSQNESPEFRLEIGRLAKHIRSFRDRSVFILYWKWGLNLDEIGEVIGVTGSAIHQALARTHLRLSIIVKR